MTQWTRLVSICPLFSVLPLVDKGKLTRGNSLCSEIGGNMGTIPPMEQTRKEKAETSREQGLVHMVQYYVKSLGLQSRIILALRNQFKSLLVVTLYINCHIQILKLESNN